MSDKTGISWTDSTWNPIRGCMVVSPGCTNCYAMEIAARFSGEGLPYEGLAYRSKSGHAVWTGEAMLVESHLEDPLRWKRPRRIFVNSMSDVFFEKVPDSYIDRVFDVMETAKQHTFQILTKRPERMWRYMLDRTGWKYAVVGDGLTKEHEAQEAAWVARNGHIWLGVSVEDQRRAEERIPILLDTPAAVRFLSCEPLLGPLDLTPWLWSYFHNSGRQRDFLPALKELRGALHWIIDGGESGRNFRPANEDWYRTIRDQCREAGVAYFHKQGSGLKSGQSVELDGKVWHEFPKQLVAV